MFIATVTHKNGINGSGYKNTMNELNAWIEHTTKMGMWGKPAGEYPLSQLSELELAQEISRKEVDEMGNLLMDPLVTIPAQYSIEITDITAEVEQEKEDQEAQNYLKETDWITLRHIREKALKIKTSLTEEEYLAHEGARQEKAKKMKKKKT